MFEIAIDSYGNRLPNITPRGVTLARTVKALTSSFKIDLNSRTMMIKVYAIAKDVYLKWANTDEDYVTAENFDEVIPAGQVLELMIPNKLDGTLFSKVQLVGRESGSTCIVIEK